MSSCDSELIAVYLANKIRDGINLEEAMSSSLKDLDGVFTYMVATEDQLGMAKDSMAAKPMVLYESDELVALASEEVAIRSSISWQRIEAYRSVAADGLYNGSVYVREGLQKAAPKAYKRILCSLSNTNSEDCL